jgi:hypothetical protein
MISQCRYEDDCKDTKRKVNSNWAWETRKLRYLTEISTKDDFH